MYWELEQTEDCRVMNDLKVLSRHNLEWVKAARGRNVHLLRHVGAGDTYSVFEICILNYISYAIMLHFIVL